MAQSVMLKTVCVSGRDKFQPFSHQKVANFRWIQIHYMTYLHTYVHVYDIYIYPCLGTSSHPECQCPPAVSQKKSFTTSIFTFQKMCPWRHGFPKMCLSPRFHLSKSPQPSKVTAVLRCTNYMVLPKKCSFTTSLWLKKPSPTRVVRKKKIYIYILYKYIYIYIFWSLWMIHTIWTKRKPLGIHLPQPFFRPFVPSALPSHIPEPGWCVLMEKSHQTLERKGSILAKLLGVVDLCWWWSSCFVVFLLICWSCSCSDCCSDCCCDCDCDWDLWRWWLSLSSCVLLLLLLLLLWWLLFVSHVEFTSCEFPKLCMLCLLTESWFQFAPTKQIFHPMPGIGRSHSFQRGYLFMIKTSPPMPVAFYFRGI